MEKDRKLILRKMRDYLIEHPTSRINMLEISKAINLPLNEVTCWLPTPDTLIEQVLNLKYEDFSEVLDFEKYTKEDAIDSMVICGQEIYEKFEQLSPANYVFIKKIKPELYQNYQLRKFDLIQQRLHNNLEKGIETGEYKSEIDISTVVKKYVDRLKAIHSEAYLNSEHFTFSNIFSNIFEDYLEEVATKENWNYFRKRKQFYEAISFVNR